jgi:hypothetical protein
MKNITKTLIFSICLAGCVGLALTMSIIVIDSWTGGPSGAMGLTFNIFHERLAETILFPIWTVIGFIASFSLLKKSCDNIDYKKTIESLQKKLFIDKKLRNPLWRQKDNGAEAPFEIER